MFRGTVVGLRGHRILSACVQSLSQESLQKLDPPFKAAAGRDLLKPLAFEDVVTMSQWIDVDQPDSLPLPETASPNPFTTDLIRFQLLSFPYHHHLTVSLLSKIPTTITSNSKLIMGISEIPRFECQTVHLDVDSFVGTLAPASGFADLRRKVAPGENGDGPCAGDENHEIREVLKN